MNERPKKTSSIVHFLRGFFFLIFSSIGMMAIGLACLAGPIKQYYDDKNYIEQENRQIEQLQIFSQQQKALLDNIKAEDPSVIKRIATYTLNYHRGNYQYKETKAIENKPENKAAGPVEVFAVIIHSNINYRRGLVIFGTILTAVALTCFSRKD